MDVHIPENIIELDFVEYEEIVSVDFTAKVIEGQVSYIRVIWDGELCDTYAKSRILELN